MREEVIHVTLAAILEESDFLSIHTSLTPETAHLVSEKELSHTKRAGAQQVVELFDGRRAETTYSLTINRELLTNNKAKANFVLNRK
jgi:hypothetical protein